nr:luminal-binding protein 8-like [Ipomoea batatas]
MSSATLKRYGRDQGEEGSVKKPLIDGIISGDLLRTNFLRPCSAYFSPSAKFSSTPAALFSLVTLDIAKGVGKVDGDVSDQLHPADPDGYSYGGEERVNLQQHTRIYFTDLTEHKESQLLRRYE